MQDFRWGRASLLSTTFFVCLAGAPAMAQQVEAPAAASADEVVVTANRREERLQDVGISVTAVTADRLESQNIRSAEDLARLVPGLNATNTSGSSVSTVVIRGVGVSDFNDHQEQPNATYQDGVYVPFSTAVGIPVFDLQRAEVLRGPQGTLFGRNATGGLVQYISNGPEAGTSGEISVAGGDRDLRRLQGFLNGGSESVAGRLSFFYQDQDGIIENTAGPDRGDREVMALRGQVEFTLDGGTSINLRAEGYDQDGTAPGFVGRPAYIVGLYGEDLPADVDAWGTGPGNDLYGYRNPNSGLTTTLNQPGLLEKESRSYSMTIEHPIGGATLTSITAFGDVHNAYTEDTDSTPFRQFEAGNVTDAESFQQDLRLSGATDNMRYTLGAFYLNIEGNYGLYNFFDAYLFNAFGVDLGAAPEAEGVTVRNRYSVETESMAIYGQLEFSLSDTITLIGGARYTWDELGMDVTVECLQTIAGGCDVAAAIPTATLDAWVAGLGPVQASTDNADWSGRLQVNYEPTDDLLFYASVSRGIKSAGFTAPLTGAFPIAELPYRPEQLTAYEIGEKAQFFDRRVTLNSSIYFYDYVDFQTFLFQNVATQVLNRDADAYGAEIELSARLGEGWSGNVGLAYNQFDVHDVATPAAPDGEDQRPINAPELQMIWGVSKSIGLGNGFDLEFNYNGRYVDEAFYNIVNVPIVEAPSYTIHDLNVRLDSPNGWWVGAYATNFTDEQYQVGAFDVSFFSWSLRQYGEPRTISLEAGMRF